MKKSIQDICILPDEELIKHIHSHRKEVQSILYNRYEKLIYYKSISILKDQHMALDMTHDIFIKIFTNINQFQGKSRFSLWIHSITFNTCVKYLSKKKKIQVFDLEDSIEEDDHSAEEFSDKVELEIKLEFLQQFIYELKEEERYLLLMKYIDGLTIKEISAITRLNESNIKMRLKRTREKLFLMYKKLNEQDS